MKDTDLDRLERDAFRKSYGDGTFDVFLGVVLGLMPLSGWLADRFTSEAAALAVPAALYVPLIAAFSLIRKYVVAPRLGRFTPARPRRRKIAAVGFALVASAALGVLLWSIFARGTAGQDLLTLIPAIWLVNCLVVFGAMAYFLDVPRFYAYGFLFGGPLALDSWFKGASAMAPGLWVSFGIPGLIVVTIGVVLFVRFLREYPANRIEMSAHGPVS